MRFIPTTIHGLLDYAVAIALISSPWWVGFYEGGIETKVPVISGIVTIVYSLCTNYEWGIFRKLSMKTHLVLDFVSGLFLVYSPWLFGFMDHVWLPHVIFGVFEMAAAMLTKKASARVSKSGLVDMNQLRGS